MDFQTISQIITDRDHVADAIRKDAEKLKKLDIVIDTLKELYPDFFKSPIQKGEQPETIKGSGDTQVYFAEWDVRLPFRSRVKSLLRSMGHFTKVNELARVAMEKEPFYSTETIDSLQEKISRTLTALQKISKTRIIKLRVHSGSSGFAWGFIEWKAREDYEKLEKQQEESKSDNELSTAMRMLLIK